MRVIGTVGLPGSGKGEAAAVAREAGIPVVTMGDVIREECRERGLNPAQHHGAVATTLREEEGPDAVARRCLPRIRAALDGTGDGDDTGADDTPADTVLIDGLRSATEAERFREAFGDAFVLVAIEAPFDLRAERLAERGRDAADADREALRERDERELDLGMGDLIEAADVRIENDGGLDAFRARVRDLLGVEATGDGARSGSDDPTGGAGA